MQVHLNPSSTVASDTVEALSVEAMSAETLSVEAPGAPGLEPAEEGASKLSSSSNPQRPIKNRRNKYRKPQ
jgi:hypothetical protein